MTSVTNTAPASPAQEYGESVYAGPQTRVRKKHFTWAQLRNSHGSSTSLVLVTGGRSLKWKGFSLHPEYGCIIVFLNSVESFPWKKKFKATDWWEIDHFNCERVIFTNLNLDPGNESRLNTASGECAWY